MNKEFTPVQLAEIIDCVHKHSELYHVPKEKGKAPSFILHTDNISETFQDLRELFKRFENENETPQIL